MHYEQSSIQDVLVKISVNHTTASQCNNLNLKPLKFNNHLNLTMRIGFAYDNPCKNDLSTF